MTYLARYGLTADTEDATFPRCQEIDGARLLGVVGNVYLRKYKVHIFVV